MGNGGKELCEQVIGSGVDDGENCSIVKVPITEQPSAVKLMRLTKIGTSMNWAGKSGLLNYAVSHNNNKCKIGHSASDDQFEKLSQHKVKILLPPINKIRAQQYVESSHRNT